MRRKAVLIAVLLLAASPAFARKAKRPQPRAAAPVTVPVTGSAIGADGRPITITGSVSVTVGDLPVPVTVPTITGVLSLARVPISQAPGGSTIFITGANLGVSGGVYHNGKALVVLAWSATEIKAILPQVTATSTGELAVAWPTGFVKSAPFTVTAAGPLPTPLPGPAPQIKQVLRREGDALPAAGVVVGSLLTISGSGFGSEWVNGQVGHVRWGPRELGKVSWSDTQIVVQLGPAGSGAFPLQVVTAAGLVATSAAVTVQGLPSEVKEALSPGKGRRKPGLPAKKK